MSKNFPVGSTPSPASPRRLPRSFGWAPQGPTDHAQLVQSWAEYNRQFGGLDPRSYLGYAVYDFFINGGQQAYIIRVVDTTSGAKTQAAPASFAFTGLTVTSANPGAWGNKYGIAIKNSTTGNKRFTLQVVDMSNAKAPVVVESFQGLSMSSTDSQFAQSIINGQSNLITVQASGSTPPDDTGATPNALQEGQDGNILQPSPVPPASVLPPLAPPNAPGKSNDFENAVLASVGFLDRVDLFNLLCVPGEGDPTTLSALEGFCHDHRAMLIIDSPSNATAFQNMQSGPDHNLTGGDNATNAAFYFPWINAPDPQQNGIIRPFPPCGVSGAAFQLTDAEARANVSFFIRISCYI